MSTKLYLGRSAFTAINPGTLGTWNNSYKQLYKMETSKQSTSFTTYTISGLGAGTTLMRQFISQKMDGGIVFDGSTTAAVVCRFSEGSSSADAFSRFYLAIVSESGTTVRVLSSAVKDGTEFATSQTARNNTVTGPFGSYTTAAGDRLVLELGWDKDGSTITSCSISLGDSSASDLTQGDADTGINNPYLLLSTTISWGGAAAPGGVTDPPVETGPTTTYDFSCSTYISAVLDEWA